MRGLVMPCASKRMRVWRVSSQARAVSSPRVRTARSVMSSRFPMGVAMMTSFATGRRSVREGEADAEVVVYGGRSRAEPGVEYVLEGIRKGKLQPPDRCLDVPLSVEPGLECLLEDGLREEMERRVRGRGYVVPVVEYRAGSARSRRLGLPWSIIREPGSHVQGRNGPLEGGDLDAQRVRLERRTNVSGPSLCS